MPPFDIPYSHTNRYEEVQLVGSDNRSDSVSPLSITGEEFSKCRCEGFIFNPPLSSQQSQPTALVMNLTPQFNSSHLNMKISARNNVNTNPFAFSFFLFSSRFGATINSTVELITTLNPPSTPISSVIPTLNTSNWFTYTSSNNTLTLRIPLTSGFRGSFQGLYYLYESEINL